MGGNATPAATAVHFGNHPLQNPAHMHGSVDCGFDKINGVMKFVGGPAESKLTGLAADQKHKKVRGERAPSPHK
jgi:hypothetical protein